MHGETMLFAPVRLDKHARQGPPAAFWMAVTSRLFATFLVVSAMYLSFRHVEDVSIPERKHRRKLCSHAVAAESFLI